MTTIARKIGGTPGQANVVINANEFAVLALADITVNVT